MTEIRSDPDGRWGALGVLAVAIVLSMTTWFSATAVLAQLRERWDLSMEVPIPTH